MILALDKVTAKGHGEVPPQHARGNDTRGPARTVFHAKTKKDPMTYANPLGLIPDLPPGP